MVSRGSKYIIWIDLVTVPNQTYERYLQVTKNKSRYFVTVISNQKFPVTRNSNDS